MRCTFCVVPGESSNVPEGVSDKDTPYRDRVSQEFRVAPPTPDAYDGAPFGSSALESCMSDASRRLRNRLFFAVVLAGLITGFLTL
ncbi:hypothetical protein GCM10010082_07250 [Kushneria pakistanensis]|uniref:Uncharacterized protein n=1 Tax=Kushneria pakistanensis TaxID=1508770 RepID=A0ABQ3FCD4_9GAMM|nr:hypothetical protein GCM10010082_07250 [Kushneria pakistanensis]